MAGSNYKMTVDSSGQNLKLNGKSVVKGLSAILYATDRKIAADSDNAVVAGPEKIKGEDAGGKYTGVSRYIKQVHIDDKKNEHIQAQSTLEMRVYNDLFVVKTKCEVNSSLNNEHHFRVEIDELPGLDKLMATFMFSDWWMKPHFDTDLAKLPEKTQLLLWQIEDGTYGCMVPMVHGGCKCHLNGRTGKLGADVALYDSGHNKTEAFAFVGGFGEDPYELVQRCASLGMLVSGRPGKLRWEKPYPEMFERVGWCTWNAMYSAVNEKGILKKMEHMKKGGFPFGYVLIDDGWSPVKDSRLTSFEIDTEKFPRGLRPLVEDLHGKYGIKEVGVWHTFTGYWGGVHSESDIYKENKPFIFDSKHDSHIPYPEVNRSFAFWNAWHTWLKDQGIQFVKVDNQGATHHHTKDAIPIGDAAKGQQYGLQASIGLNFNQNVINCMCMYSECMWHWISSNVARNSDDFWPGSVPSGCEHARQNVYNALLYSQFTWPDWDMWWTQHQLAGYHGAMRAISGGPVYVADEIDKGNYEALWPLVYADGTLIRCDQPGLPTRDSLFADPQTNPVAVKVYNKTGSAGMLAALNATEGEPTISAQMKPSDVEGLGGELFAVRDYFSAETKLLKRDEAWEFELGPYGIKLFSIVPVNNGVAVIGLGNKYISPATVSEINVFAGGASFTLAEGGEIIAFVDKKVKRMEADGKECKFRQDAGWLAASIEGNQQIKVYVEW